MAGVLPRRAEVPREQQWNVESVFPTLEEWEAAFARADAALPEFKQYQSKLGNSAQILLAVLDLQFTTGSAVQKLELYASMLYAGDESDQANVALLGKASGLQARFAAAIAFIDPEILAIAPDKLESFIRQEPGLIIYRHYFEKLELNRSHVRSGEVEAVLAEASDALGTPSRTYDALTNADLTFGHIVDADGQQIEVVQGNITRLVRSADRSVRRAAWEAYADGYLRMKNTLASCLSGSMKGTILRARVHNYPSALDAALAPFNLPRSVYTNLVSTFQANLPVWHRYWAIRKRALGVERLHVYDVHAPLSDNERVIPFNEAVDIISTGMQPLGTEYVTPMRRGLLEERWVDAQANQGKGSGAFSSGVHGTHPFIMMNYTDSLFALSTLAHELGHSLHSYFTWQNQPAAYSNYSMFVAETASNFNQAIVRAHLLKQESDPAFKLAIIEEAINNFHRYFFIMPTLARFELDCHDQLERGGALTADGMTRKLVELFREGYGDEVEIDEPRVGMTWAQFGHLYVPFYVYQYATGISAAAALAEDVLSQGEPAAKRYLDFLKAGDSVFPLDALKLAGIDMTSPEPVERAFKVLAGYVDQLDRLV